MHRFSQSPLVRLSMVSLLTALLLPTIGGCASSTSSNARGTAGEAGVQVAGLDVLAIRRMGLLPRWISTVNPLRPNGITAIAPADDAIVLVEGPDNVVTVLNAGDGQQRFKRVVGLPSEDLFRPHHRDGVLLLNSGNRAFKVDALSGELIAVDTFTRTVGGNGVLREDFLIFGAVDDRLMAHSLVSGRIAWQYQMSGNIAASPLLVGTNVFAADLEGTYGLFDGRDGNAIWRNSTFGQVSAEPVLAGSAVLVPSEDRTLYALDQTSGNDLWLYRASFPLKSSPMVVGDTIYLPAPGGEMIALWGDGNVKWQRPFEARPLLVTPRGVLAHTVDELLLFDPATGEVKARSRTGTIVQATTVGDGSLIIAFGNGRVIRFDPTG